MNTAIACTDSLTWFRLFVFPCWEAAEAFHACADALNGHMTEARADGLAVVFGGTAE